MVSGISGHPTPPAAPTLPVSINLAPVAINLDQDGIDQGQACREYAQSQLADIDAHVQAIAERILIRLPALLDASAALRAEMIDWLRELSIAVMNVLMSGADFEALSPMIEATARRRKSLGIDQAQTMHSSRYGQQALIDHAREFFRGHPQEAEMVGQMMSRLMEYQHVMTLSVARGYAGDAPGDEVSDRQAKLQLLLDLLSGQGAGQADPEPADARELAMALGIQLPLAMVTVSTSIGAGAAEHARSIARMNHWAVVGVTGDRVAALTMRTPNAFPAPSGVAQLPGSGQPEQLSAAIARASVAADVAQQLHTASMSAVDAAPFAALLAMPELQKQEFIHSCLGDLPSTARGRSLLKAVSASLTCGRLAEAALVLHVHRHTLDYRLRRFSDQTGLNLRDPAQRFRCSLALFMIGMLPAPQ